MNGLSTPMYAPMAQINPIRAEVTVDKNKVLEGEASRTYFLFFKIQGEKDFAEGMAYSGQNRFGSDILNVAGYAALGAVFPPSLLFMPVGINHTKSAAAFKAVSNSGADILVHPNYVVTRENYIFFRKVHVKVRGYAGYFKNFYQQEYCNPCVVGGSDPYKPENNSRSTSDSGQGNNIQQQDVNTQPQNNSSNPKRKNR